MGLGGVAGIVLGVLIMMVFGVITIWLDLATAVRRCRDAGINPWFVLTILIPYLGWIAVIVFGCIASESKNHA
jgi:uncharacterized membrane protein YhaH (DUF805 family)